MKKKNKTITRRKRSLFRMDAPIQVIRARFVKNKF